MCYVMVMWPVLCFGVLCDGNVACVMFRVLCDGNVACVMIRCAM